jgi:hypothetical protein
MFEQTKQLLERIEGAPRRALNRAVPLVRARIEHDAYGRHGNQPHHIKVRPIAEVLEVSATKRVIQIALVRSEPAVWREIVAQVARNGVRP